MNATTANAGFDIPNLRAPASFGINLAPIPAGDWLEGGEAQPWGRKDALWLGDRALAWGERSGSRAGQAEVLALVRGAAFEAPPPGDFPPLVEAARHISDDLCLMEKHAGQWVLTAASLCAPSYFSAFEVVGKALSGLHAPVPGFNDNLHDRVARIFDHITADQVLERRNWTLLNSDALFTPDPAPIRALIPDIVPEGAADALFVRSERQTIRRLPRTGGVLFTIRIHRQSVAQVLSHPARRAQFTSAWRAVMDNAGEPFRTYKRLDLYDALIAPLLG